MKADHTLERIEIVEDLAPLDEAAIAALAAVKIEFLLPTELDMVGGAALQFAYDSPTKYI